MVEYLYPVKYFCGGNIIDVMASQNLAMQINYFEKKLSVAGSIVGKTERKGLCLDFLAGLRLQVPLGDFHVCIRDGRTGLVLVDEPGSGVVYISLEKYCVHWQVEVYEQGRLVLAHIWDPRGQKVHFAFQSAAIGDAVAMLPYVESFGREYDCRLSCEAPDHILDLIRAYYPEIEITKGTDEDTYAAYYMNANINYRLGQAEDVRIWPMLLVGKSILGVELPLCPHKKPKGSLHEPGPYVCIALQTSFIWKDWLHPTGWQEVTDYLLGRGYRVLCIDKDAKVESQGYIMQKPEGAEDYTGDLPLTERAELLAGAEFFIGGSSGLSWLSWLMGTPVILISGMTYIWSEFPSPYRVYNPLVCHGCYHDLSIDFTKVRSGCARHGGTEREFECSKSITPRQVICAIEKLRCDSAG